MSKKFGQLFFRSLIIIFSIFCFGVTIINPISTQKSPVIFCQSQQVSAFPSISEIFKKLFNKSDEKKIEEKMEKTYVYVGGNPLGFTIMCKGVVVVAIANEEIGDIKEGDIISKIEGNEISSVSEILNLINSEQYRGKDINVEINRNGEIKNTLIKPIYDEIQKFYKLGLWVRDNAAGVGTHTYIRKDNWRVGALGHPVCEIDTGSVLPAKNGNIFKCNIVGYKKGIRGNAGELKGLFLRNSSVLGTLDSNNEYGVFGEFGDGMVGKLNAPLMEVASRNEVKSGKATIRCAISGTIPKDYEIEIVKTYFQNSKSNKSMFIRVTDEELLATTGGIVQGMSGSPIIQNGKLVGAVTHVFVSDPTKGYGIYAEWMIDN